MHTRIGNMRRPKLRSKSPAPLLLEASQRRITTKMLATCSQDDLLRMIQTIGAPTFAMDVLDNGVFRYVGLNSRLEETTALSTSRLRGKTPGETLSPARAAVVEQRCRNCVRLRKPLEYEEE